MQPFVMVFYKKIEKTTLTGGNLSIIIMIIMVKSLPIILLNF